MLNAATRLLVNKGGLFAFLVFTELLDNQCHQIIKNDFEGVAIEYKQVSNVPLLFKRTHPLSRLRVFNKTFFFGYTGKPDGHGTI